MKRRQNENEKIKITIIGMGALGILYGDLFVKALGKEAVTFLADEERIARYRRRGVTCNGESCDFQMSGRAQESDLVIFAVKGPDLDGALELAGEAVIISSRPAIILRVVDLPQPESPTRQINSPSDISILKSCTA